jgi:predicted O-linked N-acetylglucosamine transferase (SPINDLY family)
MGLFARLRAAAPSAKDAAGAPDSGEVSRLLEHARALLQEGRKQDAESAYRQLVAAHPGIAVAHANLGNLLCERGQLAEAVQSYERAIAVDNSFALAHFNLAGAQKRLGRIGDAVASLARAVAIDPAMFEAHYNLANAFDALERVDEAMGHYQTAVELRPDFVEAHQNLGNLLYKSGHIREAIESYRRALALRPDFAPTLGNLGLALNEVGEIEESALCLMRAIEQRPAFAEGYGNLGNVLMNQGRFDDAIATYRRGLELKNDAWPIHSGLLLAMNYGPSCTDAQRLGQARRFGDAVAASAKTRFAQWPCTRDATRLRVGFVSGDLRSHPVGYFLQGLLAQLDRSQVEPIAYETFGSHDELTATLRPRFAQWRSVAKTSDDALAALIRNDGVHVLIDLSGHTAHNRLPVFARRPAPVQATWLGYFATTGMREIDYCIGDPHVIPTSEEGRFVERVVRLPDSYLCFTAPVNAPDVAPPPCLANGYTTFGSFNNLAKLNDAVVALWARVLRAVPGSRLLLKTLHLNDAGARERTLARFAKEGIDAARVTLEGGSPRMELLAAYSRVDIALDPFPYPGGTTSGEGLWMGVPVVVRRGDRFLSHVGESIAHAARLSEWIAGDDDEYVAKAARFAADAQSLASLRGRLREQILHSPILDATRFARHFEAALRQMWNERQQGANA